MAYVRVPSPVKGERRKMGVGGQMNKAIFLDRDGVINPPVFNRLNNEFEPPHRVEDLNLYPWTIESLKIAVENGYSLFLVSNQPDYAKGKCSLEDLISVHNSLDEILKENNIIFKEYFYCYHHPAGVVAGYSGECECRKPKPYFLKKAKDLYSIDMEESWMIGDRETDIICGKNGGLRTILVKSEEKAVLSGNPAFAADFTAQNLSDAIIFIINYKFIRK
jgi:D-glycero-D-manno-heptose 1,7-bisphosphate phosphatase